MKDKNYPQEPGFYWAVIGDDIEAIVKVSGEAPFFTVEGYSFLHGEATSDVKEISCFGNKIEE